MRVEIEITRRGGDDEHVVYDFCTDTPSPGRLRIHRETGQVIHLERCGCAGDPEYHGRRAGRAVWQCWRSGELPERTRYVRE